jgi:hypothetical protein
VVSEDLDRDGFARFDKDKGYFDLWKKKMALGGFKWLVLLLFFLVLFVFV